MSTRYNNGSHYENHQRAAELHDAAAHAHRSAEQQYGKQDHLTGHEHSRQALEHSGAAYQQSQATSYANGTTGNGTTGHGVVAFGHDDIAALAHRLWEERGSAEGTPHDDWYRAVAELRSRKIAD